jgi:hypothetical protein
LESNLMQFCPTYTRFYHTKYPFTLAKDINIKIAQ